jgi:RND family efflux transporter MFP subunit
MLLYLAGFFHAKVPGRSRQPDQAVAATHKTAIVRHIKRPRMETAIGTVKPVHEAAVGSKILARVLEVNVKAGQVVKQDDVLVRLDDADLQARLKQAEAQLAGAQADLTRAQTDIERARQLKSRQAISSAEYDRVEATHKAATAVVARGEQSVREAEVLLEYATIRSPLTGTVIDKRVEAGDTAAPGQVLLTLYDPGKMQLVATVRESLAQRLKPGQQLPVRLESIDHECDAMISEIVPEAQAASRSFTVKVTGPCPPGVYSGMFGRLMIPLEDEEILVVPEGAIQRVGQLTVVDVVADGHVQRRSIQLGRSLDGQREVLSGLQAGEQVVIQPTPPSQGKAS